MNLGKTAVQKRFNAWLLRVGRLRVVLAITIVSVVLSVLMTGVANAIFMPDEPLEDWLYVSAIVPALISPIVSTTVLSLVYQLAEARAALVTMSETDPLTGVGNRRKFVQRAAHACSEAALTGAPVSIVLLDVDKFKQLNDTYGHAVGDEALIVIANACRQGLRATDLLCRWGGEEFIVLLPGANMDAAVRLAERLRASVAAAIVASVPQGVTISLGVAELNSGTLDEAIASADRRLYRAKDAGRNRVEPPPPAITEAEADAAWAEAQPRLAG